jgi:hypothetical protein
MTNVLHTYVVPSAWNTFSSAKRITIHFLRCILKCHPFQRASLTPTIPPLPGWARCHIVPHRIHGTNHIWDHCHWLPCLHWIMSSQWAGVLSQPPALGLTSTEAKWLLHE